MKAMENREPALSNVKGAVPEPLEGKKGWQTKTFSEVLEIRNGRSQREVESASGEFPIYGSAGNVMGMASDYICEAGTTIIGRKGNINSPFYADTRFWNVDTAFGLAAKPSLDSRFLYFFCLSYDFSAHNRGTTIPSLVKSELLNISIPVPPLAEQQRIVGLLDEAFEGLATAKANAEKNLQNARALFESHLQSVFTQRGEGWVEKRLEDVCGLQNGFAFKSSTFKPSGAPILRISNIQDGRIEAGNRLVFFDPKDYRENLDRYRIVEDDLLIAMSGATTGKLGFNTESTVYYLNQRVGKFEPSPKLNKRFLYPMQAPDTDEEFRETNERRPKRQRVKVKLADGKERTIQHMMMTSFWHPDGTPMSARQFMEILFGKLPEFFKDEAELRAIWSAPDTRKKLLQGLAEKGFGHEQLTEMQQIIDAEKSDLFDVLAHVAYALPPVTREVRAANARGHINTRFDTKQQAFLSFVLQHYITVGVTELDPEKLTPLLLLKYHNSLTDAVADLGGQPEAITKAFAGFQKYLYQQTVAA